jgi:prephenate dehydratase
MRVGYFGPEGTFTHEALMSSAGTEALELIPLPTIYDTVMAVHHGEVARALVPIENSLEGSVNATLDALAMETEDVAIVAEVIYPIRHCLIARTDLELGEIEAVISHPQATAQCARFIRAQLGHAQVLVGSSTAEAVRTVAEHDGPWAALGNRLAAEHYGCRILRQGVEDVSDNETRFVWLGPTDAPPGVPGGTESVIGPWKTAIVFWGIGDDGPGWLVGCMAELSAAQINLTRIESRPRKQGLGHYMFFVDLEGHATEPHVRGALEALRGRVEVLRILGSFAAATS